MMIEPPLLVACAAIAAAPVSRQHATPYADDGHSDLTA